MSDFITIFAAVVAALLIVPWIQRHGEEQDGERDGDLPGIGKRA